MDSIRRFKLARQIIQPVERHDELDELVKLYETIGPTDGVLKQDFKLRWDKLPEEKRSELVKRLLILSLLPSVVRDALEIFKGKIVNLV